MKQFYNARDVCEVVGISKSKAYVIMQQLNKELESKGYITVKGKIPKAYLEERLFIAGKEEI